MTVWICVTYYECEGHPWNGVFGLQRQAEHSCSRATGLIRVNVKSIYDVEPGQKAVVKAMSYYDGS